MWFVTWGRKEYREWAREQKGGYALVILCAEEGGSYLCVKARLDMQSRGMPAFVTEEEQRFASLQQAEAKVEEWKRA
jgi:hypothetical protein